MRLDSHLHFWTFTGNESDNVWMTRDYAVLGRNFDVETLRPLLKSTGYAGTIAVQARNMPRETDYLLQLATDHS